MAGSAADIEGARPAAVELRGVFRNFGSVRAVDGIDLSLQLGQICALLRPNGAGKTTTIDMMLGLGRPDRGSVTVLGLSPERAVSRGLVSAVLQNGGLLKDLTVGETVRLTATLYPEALRVQDVMERAGIKSIADRLVGRCSVDLGRPVGLNPGAELDPRIKVAGRPATSCGESEAPTRAAHG